MTSSIVALLRDQAEVRPDCRFTFVVASGDAAAVTYRELDQRARSVAAVLSAEAQPGSRAILVYPPGLDFLIALFGAMYANVTPVPVYPPTGAQLDRWIERLEATFLDADPTHLLTTQELLDLKTTAGIEIGSGTVRWLGTDSIPSDAGDDWRPRPITPDNIALIQYTSGSTSSPKGVVLPHRSLLANQRVIDHFFGLSESSVAVSWLPVFHDMGLIGCVLGSLYVGCPCYLMSPVTFLQRPMSWLETISRVGGTCSGGPTFGFELCTRRATEEDRAKLDLSQWDVAFTGAEVVRPDVLRRFADAFAISGFRYRSFLQGYGLAEASLLISCSGSRPEVRTLAVDTASLQQGTVRKPDNSDCPVTELVAAGNAPPEHEVAIVDASTGERVLEGQVGEIWARGPSIAVGYWRREDVTEATFHASVVGEPGSWLRTGDLGFIRDGHLYITGRLKEVMLVRGRNIYPQDVESVAQASDPALRPGCGAAFEIDDDGISSVALVQETTAAGDDLETQSRGIRRAVAEQLGAPLAAVLLVAPRTVSKTSSGKIQRIACRSAFAARTLEPLHEWRRTGARRG